ncbi:MAG: asparagine synthase (glutamine-hydrolyzing) [Alphaproteobacteria bacterium]|nr:asparagine synthase (glutamine-hydrolyzing) [Alphaproteobacteria bacterium]
MCGFTGFFALKATASRSELHVMGQKMSDTIIHRGPDSGNLWQDPDTPLVLAHRRLSIIDLTKDGEQPMTSSSERYVIVFNGEFYNFQNLRRDLEAKGVKFKGRSDTEVFLAAVEQWGLNQALQKTNGMFSFALWDRKDKVLHFARDRLGKKPLYVGWAGNHLVFGSELKALRAHPEFEAQINAYALQGFLRMNYIEAPETIYYNIWQLPAGHRMSLDLSTLRTGDDLLDEMKAYWDPVRLVDDSKANMVNKHEDKIVDDFERLLTTCVSDRMISDVPLGAFLSGGIDSSAVVALMQKQAGSAVKTYSIGFEEEAYNEAQYAKDIAQHLGTDHHEHICTGQDALNVIPKLPDMYDEPFADMSAIPTFLVSEFARRDVTVALSGDGGDEMLGGYVRHTMGPKIWKTMRMMPKIVRSGISGTLQRLPEGPLDRLRPSQPQFGYKLQKAARIMSLNTQEEVYERLICKWLPAPVPDKDIFEPVLPLPRADLSFAEKMMLWDTVGYLPNDILTKVDRASMAVSLEARAPLLDHRVFEYCWRLPEHVKIRDQKGKWLLRQVLKKHVPEKLFERPKQGFAIPVADWLRGPLREWAEDLLDERSLKQQGYLDAKTVRDTWTRHLDGQGRNGEALWAVLMFQAWHKRWM